MGDWATIRVTTHQRFLHLSVSSAIRPVRICAVPDGPTALASSSVGEGK